MSKAIKKLIVDELVAGYQGDKSLIVANFSGIDAQQTNAMRRDLSGKERMFRPIW